MTNLEVIKTIDLLNSVSFVNVQHTGLNYAIEKNLNKLEAEKKLIQKTLDKSKTQLFTQLQDEISPMINKAIEKAKAENPDITTKQLQAIEYRVMSQWEKLDQWEIESKNYKKIIDGFYEQENPFVPFNIKYSVIDPLKLNGEQMKAIFYFITEDQSNTQYHDTSKPDELVGKA